MWVIIARLILRNRLALIIILTAITAFMTYKASQVQLSYEFAKALPVTDKDYLHYLNFKDKFGEDGSVLVIGVMDQDFYKLEKFNDWYDLTYDIKRIKGIEEVVSLARIYNLEKNDSLRKFELKPVITSKPTTQAKLDSLKQVITSLPFYSKLLFNKETNAHLMAITFDKKLLHTRNRIDVVNTIKQKAEEFQAKHRIELHFSGLPYIRTAISSKVAKELQLFVLLAVLVTGLILLVFFRSFNAVVFSLLVVTVGVIWSLGTITLFNYKITLLTGLIPPLIIVIGVPNSIFLLNKYQQEFRRHGNKIKALSRMIEKIGLTTFFANVTTAIGFGVFYFTNSAILVEFGLVAALNVMATYIISLILIPIVFSYLPPPALKHTKHLQGKNINKILENINYAVHNHRTIIYISIICIVIVSFIGITKLNTVGYVVDDLPKNDPVYVDMKFFEENFNGVLPLEISIDTKKEGGALNINNLYKINKLQKILSKHPELSKSVSAVDAVKFSYQAYKGGDPRYYVLPNSLELAKLGAYTTNEKGKENRFKSFIDSTKQHTRISIQVADIGSVKMKKLLNEIRPRVDSLFNPQEYNVKITGNSLMFLKGNDYLLLSLKESVLLSIILIAIVMFTLFMSFRMIAISILPSLIPLLITAGLMGYLDIPLKPSSILVFSIAFGIASDGTIYFLTKYRQELKNHSMSISQTVSATIRETGVSMVYTAIILFCGFSIFAASSFGGTVALGILISITLLIAMCSNLILLPCLLVSLERKLTTKAFLKEPLFQIYDEEEDIELDSLEIKKVPNKENDL